MINTTNHGWSIVSIRKTIPPPEWQAASRTEANDHTSFKSQGCAHPHGSGGWRGCQWAWRVVWRAQVQPAARASDAPQHVKWNVHVGIPGGRGRRGGGVAGTSGQGQGKYWGRQETGMASDT